jgi:hypothetical protein
VRKSPSSSCLWPHGADRDRNGQISPCGPPSSPLSLFFSFCTVLIGTHRATASLLFLLVPIPFFLLRSSHVQVDFVGAQGWFVTLAGYLLFDGEIESCCRWHDLQWLWMLIRQWIWGHLPYQAFNLYPDLEVDLPKLSLVESPKTQIGWHLMPWKIRFDFLVSCLYGNLVSSLLSFRTSPAAAALVTYWIVIKPCVCCYVVGVVVVVVFFLFLYCFLLLLCFVLLYSLATLFVGFTTLFVGFCFPLCRDVVLLCFPLCRDVVLLLLVVVVVFSFVV